MPSLPINFGQTEDAGLEEMGGAVPLSVNVLADASKAVRKRPGLSAWADFPTPAAVSEVQAIEVFGDYLVFVTADRKIHAWLASGLVRELSDATAATQLDGDRRPVMLATKTRLIIAGGGALQYWDGVSVLSARLPGSPPVTTHAVGINTRLVVNPRGNTGQVAWSEAGELAGHIDWTHGNFLELEARPDPCIAIYDNTDEIVGIGTKTIQMLSADPVAGFVTVRTHNFGSLSPYSFVEADSTFGLLDHLKRIQLGDGRGFDVISSPSLTATLADLATVSDVWAFRLAAAKAWDLFVWVFPTERKAFVYNPGAKAWSEWRGRSSTGWTGLPFSSYCYFPAQGLHLVGTASGQIKVLDFAAATDDGDVLHAEMVSAFADRGNKKLKLCEGVRLVFRTTPGTTPVARLSWRDDQGAWADTVTFEVDETNIVEIRTLGEYRMRQWRLELDDDVPMSLIRAEEDYQVLEM